MSECVGVGVLGGALKIGEVGNNYPLVMTNIAMENHHFS